MTESVRKGVVSSGVKAGKSKKKPGEGFYIENPSHLGTIEKMDIIPDEPEDEEKRFECFYETHSKRFWYFILKICGDESMADDIFQESYFRFLKADPRGMADYQLKAYLYKIAVRLIIDHRRKIHLEEKSISSLKENEGKKPDILLSMDMDNLFKHLKPEDRTLLWLAYIEGYSHREIADIIGKGEKTIKVNLYRVRRKFAGILKAGGYDGDLL